MILGCTTPAWCDDDEDTSEVSGSRALARGQARRDSLVAAVLPTESPALHQRMLHPERLFLWNEIETVGPGDVFYASPDWTRRLMWAGQIDPATEWLGLTGGSKENQNPLEFDFRGSSKEGLGSVVSGEIEYSLLPQLRLRALANKNDIDTKRTMDYTLGEASFSQRGGNINGTYAQGRRWARSPITGSLHPWDVRLTRIGADYGEGNGLYLDLAQWESPNPSRLGEGKGLASEVGIRLSGGEEGWRWRLLWGYSRRTLQSDSATAFQPLEDERFPFTLYMQRRFVFENQPNLEWHTDAKATSREGILSLQGQSLLKPVWGRHHGEIGVEVYGAYRYSSATIAREITGDSLNPDLGDFRPGLAGRGIAAVTGYEWVGKSEKLRLHSKWVSEWERPVFEATDFENANAQVSRQGLYRPSDYALFNWPTTLALVTSRLPFTEVAAFMGIRPFYGQEAGFLEYQPSLFWAGSQAAMTLPSHTSILIRTEWVSEKTVRDWPHSSPTTSNPTSTNPLSIAPHLETQIGASQGFWANHLTAHIQVLNVFGNAIQDHPVGHALQFHGAVGLDGRW